jgi:transporter family protein
MIQWYYLALGSSVVMALSTIVEKGALRKEHASAYSASFTLLTFLISLVFLPFADFNISALQLLYIFLLGITSSAGFLLTARVFKHGSISVASPIFSSLPVLLTVVGAFLFLGERLTYVNYAAIAIIVVAIYLILFKSSKSKVKTEFDGSKYLGYIALVAVINAFGAVFLRYLLLSINPLALLVLLEGFIALDTITFTHLRYGGLHEAFSNLRKNRLPIFTTSVFTTTSRVLYYLSVSVAFVSLVSPLRNSIYVVMVVLSGGMFFGEKGIAKKVALSALLIVAAYFLTV